MPLKALLDGQPLLAPLLGDTAWAELYFQRHRLALPCCPDRAVQMRGGAGTTRIQHFSHAPAPTCRFRGETMTHLRAKVAIARACADAGWAVDIEHAEADWRADVLAERGGARVAFEAQWSRQTLAETERRQERYRAAGVRGCWFVRYPPHDVCPPDGAHAPVARHDLPLFVLAHDRESDADRVRVEQRSYALGPVVGALLAGRIAFRAHRTFRGAHALDLTFYDKACPSCGTASRLYGLAAHAGTAAHASCGGRVLLWSDALYHPDIVRAARRVFAEAHPPDTPALAGVEPHTGFRCPTCRARIAPFRANGYGPAAMTLPARVFFTRPLCDPYPHWCYPQEGAFCAPIAGEAS